MTYTFCFGSQISNIFIHVIAIFIDNKITIMIGYDFISLFRDGVSNNNHVIP